MPSKADLWDDWIADTLLRDVRSGATLDPVEMFDITGEELDTTDAFDSYRYGRGDGEFLYLLYLLDRPVSEAADVTPVYLGETNSVTSRLYQHFKRIREALPIEDWTGDGSWGSWSKYDHIAAVYDRAEGPLYVWICDVDTLDAGPYGYPTYRQELEPKLVGLVHSQPRFERVFANREFVPNRVLHEMGTAGPTWVTGGAEGYTPTRLPEATVDEPDGRTKRGLWHEWVDKVLLADIEDPTADDPIPLFDTDEDLRVRVSEGDGLVRSDAIDARIRREGRRCVDQDGVPEASPDGLLYVLYQLEDQTDPTAADVAPRYIGKAEAYGKKRELSANFDEIVKDRDATRSFARWGDGEYWHTGELSMAVLGEDTRKVAWASELFEQGTHTLREQTYLWVRAWDPETHGGPYGYSAYLAEAEPLLIGLAYAAAPNRLLNQEEVPDAAPVKTREYHFETAER